VEKSLHSSVLPIVSTAEGQAAQGDCEGTFSRSRLTLYEKRKKQRPYVTPLLVSAMQLSACSIYMGNRE
jgi:hypothetical protein